MRTVLFLFLAALVARAETDVVALLSSKNPLDRLKAIAAIQEQGHPDAEAMLLKALKDKDWEVVHRAVDALGKVGSADAFGPLIDMAVKGPTRRVRWAAVDAAMVHSRSDAAEALSRRLKSKTLVYAAEGLARIGDPVALKGIERLIRDVGKNPTKRIVGLRALGALKDPAFVPALAKFLNDSDIRVRDAAVHALVDIGHPSCIPPLREGLKQRLVPAVMERRLAHGIRTLLLKVEDEKKRTFSAQMLVRSLGMAPTAQGNASFARLLGILGRADKPVGPVDEYVDALMGTGCAHSSKDVRAAAVFALARIGQDRAYEKVMPLAKTDSEHRVRFHAMRAAVKLRGEKALPLVLDRLRYDDNKSVREEAATICARIGKADAVPTLIKALQDKDWEVSVCAAVSLGKLRAEPAVEPLAELYRESKDWRLRGGAIAGLGRIKHVGAVPVLLEALRDRSPAVVATSLEYLRKIAGKKGDANARRWREWWGKHEKNFTFRDIKEESKQAKKYGYALARRGVYEGLDIIVLATRKGGDNIQFLLTDYEIEHRIVRAASLIKLGLHPTALFVANCPGEIVSSDIEVLQWYVRTGGYLFASCWALTHTIHAAFPEVVDKLPLKGQVIGTVFAQECPVKSPYIAGVFDDFTSPLYELMGSHLIRVLDPERFEVLIDSPHAASIWGDGNLAGWFTVGHGTILDSANHFDLQGMGSAKDKSEKGLMAFCVDHLGYDYAALRKLQAEGVFRTKTRAEKATRDQSTFRFITTFVRQKRIADEE